MHGPMAGDAPPPHGASKRGAMWNRQSRVSTKKMMKAWLRYDGPHALRAPVRAHPWVSRVRRVDSGMIPAALARSIARGPLRDNTPGTSGYENGDTHRRGGRSVATVRSERSPARGSVTLS